MFSSFPSHESGVDLSFKYLQINNKNMLKQTESYKPGSTAINSASDSQWPAVSIIIAPNRLFLPS